MIVFGSLFSGIGGFDLGFERAGMRCAWQCEIDAAARGVLARQFGKPIMEDVRDVRRDNVAAVDLVCGGFPCQDLSVTGKRAGLAGERSGLWFEFRRVLDELRPQWVVIENVPGLLSSNGGRDFAVVLRGLVELGYGVAWRVLDAQYFGVAQRRRRVFIVGSLGNGRAAEVLFESEGMFGHSPARREAGQGVATTATPLTASGRGTERAGESRGQDTLIPVEPQTFDWQAGSSGDESWKGKARSWIVDQPGRTRSLSASRTLAVAYGGNNTSGPLDVATACNAHDGSGRMDFESETFVFETRFARNGRGAPDTIAPPLKAENGQTGKGDGAPVVVFQSSQSGVREVEQHPSLDANNGSRRQNGVIQASGIRRLTPTECERLQGFPDGWTAGQSDSARYRQLGNAVAVPVIEWIGRRIAEADSGSGVPVPD